MRLDEGRVLRCSRDRRGPRLDYDAGDGVGNTKKQQLEERADLFVFALWQMGVPGYQPR